MTGFDYIFTSTGELLQEMSIDNMSIISIVYFLFGIIFITSMVLYIIPHVDVWFQSMIEEKNKKKKKQLMNKIVLQKSLEDIIAKELEKGKT